METETIKLEAKTHDLGGGFIVSRVLPQAKKRMVGPFIFFDHMGPVDIAPLQNIDVRPHPHIGLSTLTYLLEGRMVHKDSLGSDLIIVPGDVNWMTAGKGISHSERGHPDDRMKTHRMEGLQLWIALPESLEDVEPSFRHYENSTIPRLENSQYSLSLVAGEAFGLKSPVQVSSPLLLVSVEAKSDNASMKISFKDFEIGVYVIKGELLLNGELQTRHQMTVVLPGTDITIQFGLGASFVILGGEPFQSTPFIWWNLVSSSKEKIEAAKQKWIKGSFPMVPGETEFIPAPH